MTGSAGRPARVVKSAQAWGLPNVLHDTARSRAVTGGIGHFVDTDDIAAMADALATVATDTQGPHEPSWRHAHASGWARVGPAYVDALAAIASAEPAR